VVFCGGTVANARFLITSISLPHGACHVATAENCPARSAGPCVDRERLIGFCPRKSAFKTSVTPPTALSGSNPSILGLCRRHLTFLLLCGESCSPFLCMPPDVAACVPRSATHAGIPVHRNVRRVRFTGCELCAGVLSIAERETGKCERVQPSCFYCFYPAPRPSYPRS
jgi:hypothetical protein